MTRGLKRRAGIIAASGLLFVGAQPARACESCDIVNALGNADMANVLHSQSIMSHASLGLFEGPLDYAFRPDLVGQLQRDEVTRGLSRPSNGTGGDPNMLFTNLASLNSADTFSIGGVRKVGPGNLALFGGYQNWQDWTMSDDNEGSSSSNDSNMRAWQLVGLYGWGVGDGYVGVHFQHSRLTNDDSNKSGSQSSNAFEGKYTLIDAAYSQPVGEHGGWAVGAWLSQTDIESSDRFISGSARSKDVLDVSGPSFGLYGRYNFALNHADGEVSAAVRRGKFDLDSPTTFLQSSFGTNIRDRVSSDDTKRTNYEVGWRFLSRLGDKVDFAYGVQYDYSKLDSSVEGITTFTSKGSSTQAFENSNESKNRAFMIPVAGRMQLTSKLWLYAGAGFQYYWTEDATSDRSGGFVSKDSGEHKHTATNYAAGLRLDFNEHISGEIGMLNSDSVSYGSAPTYSTSTSGSRDTVNSNKLNFQFTFSF